MTAPLFNLPIASPVAGAAPQNLAQGAAAGFEALLAAFFGTPGESVEGAQGAVPAAVQDDKAPAADKAEATPSDPTATPTDALGLVSVLMVQQPQQAAPSANEEAPATDAQDGPKTGAGVAGSFTIPAGLAPDEAAPPAAPPKAAAGQTDEQALAQPQAIAPDVPARESNAAKPASAVVPAGNEDAAAASPDSQAGAAKQGTEGALAAPTKGAPAPAHTSSPAKPAVSLPATEVKAPATAPAEAELAALPSAEVAEAAAAVAQPSEQKPATARPQRTSDATRRAAEMVSGPQAPAADAPSLPTAVKPVADASAAIEATSSTEAATPAPQRETAKVEVADTPDFQPPAPAAAAHAGAHAAHAAAPVRVTSETVANLTASISKKLEGRATKFDVELTPAGLGHVSVSVEIAASGKMTAAMSFDTPQAAAELRARSHELQKALEQAGFDIAGGLSFDVNGDRGEGRNFGQQQHENDAGWRGRAFQAVLGTAGEAAETAASAALQYARRSDAGVDIRI